MAFPAQDIAVPVQQPQVQRSLEQLQNTLDSLRGALGDLTQRLAGVLRPAAPTTGASGSSPKEVESKAPLAETLDALQAKADEAHSHVVGLIRRVEI